MLFAFVATRSYLLAAARWPINVAASSNDIALYEGWARRIVQGAWPYGDVAIEYPPGSLPFMLLPRLAAGVLSYEVAFTILMVAIDIAGALGLLAIARRTRVTTGLWVWILGTFLLGPIVYGRLDLAPAVITIWAVERISAGSPAGSGALFAFGAVTKLYPAVLVPGAWWHSRDRLRFIIGAGIVTALALVPFSGVLPGLWDSVVGYHGGRAIQIESSWGAALMIAREAGYDPMLEFSAGALHFRPPIVGTLKMGAALASLIGVVAATWVVVRRVARGDHGAATAGLYGVLAVTMFASTVLSPQFVVWLIALAGAALCFEIPSLRRPLLLVLPIAALTQLEFPFMFTDLRDGDIAALTILVARNVLILVSGIAVLVSLSARRPRSV